METVCNVGYALNAKKLRKGGTEKSSKKGSDKWCGGGLADILKVDSCSQGVSFKPFNFATMDCDFHVIIHKLTDWDSEESSSKLSAIEAYMAEHPSTVIIDPLSSIKKITSRSRACECLQRVLDNEPTLAEDCDFRMPFLLPSYCVIGDKRDFRHQMDMNNITFPIICKPIHACGTPESHLMVVLVSCKDIELIPSFPCLVQQYHNHDGNFYKVYVIGSDVMVHQRPSLPDLSGVLMGAEEIAEYTVDQGHQLQGNPENPENPADSLYGVRSVVFDSRHTYPTWEEFHFPLGVCDPGANTITCKPVPRPVEQQVNGAVVARCKPAPRPVEQQVNGAVVARCKPVPRPVEQQVNGAVVARCKAAAAIVQKEFNLSLFGFDVILPCRSSSASTPSTSSNTSTDSPGDAATDIEITTDDTPLCEARDVDILVIDVNFFPSYKEVGDFPQRLSALLRSKAGLPPWSAAMGDVLPAEELRCACKATS